MPQTPMRRLAAAAVAVAALATVAGCSADTTPSATGPATSLEQVSAGTLATGDPAPAPDAQQTVLTITGAPVHNAGDRLRLSLAQLDEMRQVEARVWEPFKKKHIVFRGVALADVLAFAGVDHPTGKLHTVALNEYAVDIPTTVLDEPGCFIATRADGKPIPVAKGGPIRVVFTDDHPQAKDQSLWNWSLASIKIP